MHTYPQLGSPVTIRSDNKGFGPLAVLASVLVHLWLAWLFLTHRFEETLPHPPVIVFLARQTEVVPPPAKPVELPHPVVTPPVAPLPAHRVTPERVIRAKPSRLAPQPETVTPPSPPATPAKASPLHFGAAGSDSDLDLDSGEGNGHAAIAAFDDDVKKRILAAKTYPPGLPHIWNECVVGYRVTVDRTGQLLDYKIDGCGNPFLDSATRSAILKASPFPVPPNFGGEKYDIYGSLVYTHR